jgi:hypothetical protein
MIGPTIWRLHEEAAQKKRPPAKAAFVLCPCAFPHAQVLQHKILDSPLYCLGFVSWSPFLLFLSQIRSVPPVANLCRAH